MSQRGSEKSRKSTTQRLAAKVTKGKGGKGPAVHYVSAARPLPVQIIAGPLLMQRPQSSVGRVGCHRSLEGTADATINMAAQRWVLAYGTGRHAKKNERAPLKIWRRPYIHNTLQDRQRGIEKQSDEIGEYCNACRGTIQIIAWSTGSTSGLYERSLKTNRNNIYGDTFSDK
ncbi:hypothetical protein EVAR_9992_1 [Eumeta japonica]|uniref:Uncharacterized protein n=1 Tax=Eumeta variegata TaxID=151549 RepID=A0A4C1TQZ3_EUMVA|nr:hypothetical protein EVAR_9992_1 [Eumeta japonica]